MGPVHLPAFTMGTAGILGLLFAILSVRVVAGRMTGKTMLGEGDAGELQVGIRSHANFAEYVPLCLLLLAGLEMRSGPTLVVKLLATCLVLARVAHPVGMVMKAPNPFRAGGFVLTLLVLAVASVAVLVAMFSPEAAPS